MKLFLCPECQDVKKFGHADDVRTCRCGESGGRYLTNGVDGVTYGQAIPLGFANPALSNALKHRPEGPELGKTFEAFVIPEECRTIEHREIAE